MSFEKLRVYQAAEMLDRQVSMLVRATGKMRQRDVDQLRRAAPSVAYNIAEAFGSAYKGRKVYHLGVARGSADETRSILRKLARDGFLSPESIRQPCTMAVTVAKMLTAWIERLRESEGSG